MPFSQPVGHIVNHILARLAVADGMPLTELWRAVAEVTNTPEIDALQKNVVWRGLMSASPEPLFAIAVRQQAVPVAAELAYGELLARGSEAEVVLRPTEDCQYRYLANTADYHQLKAQIGALPFQLLVVVARHGAQGVANADLAREAGQDIRSIRLRLQKLEEAGLVVCRPCYVQKKHTTVSVHVRFWEGGGGAGAPSPEDDEPLDQSRDIRKLTVSLLGALKAAPNGVRGFADIQRQLSLHGSVSAQKFFRAVCLKLHRSGYLEKVSVELPETRQRVHALQFRRNLPQDAAEMQPALGAWPDISANGNGPDIFGLGLGLDDAAAAMPQLNTVFPIYHQIYAHIAAATTAGVTTGEISKTLAGISDYRPYTRLSELYATYLSNAKDLKPFKKYAEPYDETSVTKLYENEGKLRFYKYFATQYCTEKRPAPKPYTFTATGQASKLGLEALERRLGKTKKSISREALVGKRTRMFQLDPESPPADPPSSPRPPKRQKVTEPAHTGDIETIETPTETPPEQSERGAVDVALAAQVSGGRVLRRRRAAPRSFVPEEAFPMGDESGDDFVPPPEPADDADVHMDEYASENDSDNDDRIRDRAVIDDLLFELHGSQAPTLAARDLPTFLPAQKQSVRKQPGATEPVRKRAHLSSIRAESSSKSVKRRDLLVELMREAGGAVFKSASLFRKLDSRLAGSTTTDRKTLARDIEILAETGVLETQKINVAGADERPVEKRILILTDPAHRPTPASLSRLKEVYVGETSKKNMQMLQKRTIEFDLDFVAIAPEPRPISTNTRYRRGNNRLDTLADAGRRRGRKKAPEAAAADGTEPTAKPRRDRKKKTQTEKDANTNADEGAESDGTGVLERIKRVRRPRKAAVPSAPFVGQKRTRRNIKLESADATTLYRCIVMWRAFSRDSTDFEAISRLLGDMDPLILKQKWGTLRRSFGGTLAVSKGVETFRNMVLHGISEGEITEEDLVKCDLGFFLEYWRSFDSSTEFEVADGMPLFATVEANTQEYSFTQMFVTQNLSLAERIEDQSMRQKEFILGELAYSYEANRTPDADPDDTLKSKLKAIFVSQEGAFDPSRVKTVLSDYGERRVKAATDALQQAREIAHIAFDDTSKFVVGERFKVALQSKAFGEGLLKQAAAFKETLHDISEAGRGLILSQGIQAGEIATVLELVSCNMVDLMRIDRPLKFENYESRLVDKEQIGCDMVVRSKYAEPRNLQPRVVSVPHKSFCQPVWVDLGANINTDLWKKILVSILACVVFKPGIPEHVLHDRMQAVLCYADYCDAVGWLEQSGCVERTAHNGIVATNRWPYILGY